MASGRDKSGSCCRAMIKELLNPHQAAQVRAKRVEYGDVLTETAKRKAYCRCCNGIITKGESILSFYWDFHGCGSWTASKAQMHVTCEPASAEVRSEVNGAAHREREERRAEKLIEQSFSAGPRKAHQLQKEARRIRERLVLR